MTFEALRQQYIRPTGFAPGVKISERGGSTKNIPEVIAMEGEIGRGNGSAILYELLQNAVDFSVPGDPPYLAISSAAAGSIERRFVGQPFNLPTLRHHSLTIHSSGNGLAPEQTVIFDHGERGAEQTTGARQGEKGRGSKIAYFVLKRFGADIRIVSNWQGIPWIGQINTTTTTTGTKEILLLNGEWQEGSRQWTNVVIHHPPDILLDAINKLPEEYLDANPKYPTARLVPVEAGTTLSFREHLETGTVELVDDIVKFKAGSKGVFCDKKRMAAPDPHLLAWHVEGFPEAKRGVASEELQGTDRRVVGEALRRCTVQPVWEKILDRREEYRRTVRDDRYMETPVELQPISWYREKETIIPAVAAAIKGAWDKKYPNAVIVSSPDSLEILQRQGVTAVQCIEERGLYNLLLAAGVKDGLEVAGITPKQKVEGFGRILDLDVPPLANTVLEFAKVEGVTVKAFTHTQPPRLEIQLPQILNRSALLRRGNSPEKKVMDLVLATARATGFSLGTLETVSNGKRFVYDIKAGYLYQPGNDFNPQVEVTEYALKDDEKADPGTLIVIEGDSLAKASRKYDTLAARLEALWDKQTIKEESNKLVRKATAGNIGARGLAAIQIHKARQQTVLAEQQALLQKQRQELELLKKNPAGYLFQSWADNVGLIRVKERIITAATKLRNQLSGLRVSVQDIEFPRIPRSTALLAVGLITLAGLGIKYIPEVAGPALQSLQNSVGQPHIPFLKEIVSSKDWVIEPMYPSQSPSGYYRTQTFDTPSFSNGRIVWTNTITDIHPETPTHLKHGEMPDNFIQEVKLDGLTLGNSMGVPLRIGEKVIAFKGNDSVFKRDLHSGYTLVEGVGNLSYYTGKDTEESYLYTPPTEADQVKFLGDLRLINSQWRDFIVKVRDSNLSYTQKIAWALAAWHEKFVYDDDPSIDYSGNNITEIFAKIVNTQRGICNVSAAGFFSILREIGVPTRINAGYLNGDYDLTGNETHNWPYAWNGERWIQLESLSYNMSERSQYIRNYLEEAGITSEEYYYSGVMEEAFPTNLTIDDTTTTSTSADKVTVNTTDYHMRHPELFQHPAQSVDTKAHENLQVDLNSSAKLRASFEALTQKQPPAFVEQIPPDKETPIRVAVGAAGLAIGAGLGYAAAKRRQGKSP